jgi:hypothetical protein
VSIWFSRDSRKSFEALECWCRVKIHIAKNMCTSFIVDVTPRLIGNLIKRNEFKNILKASDFSSQNFDSYWVNKS